MIRILLCCATGMSTSILVRQLRQEAEARGIECKIGATSATQAGEYIPKVDVLLVAPHSAFDEPRLRGIAERHGTKVVLIDRQDYSAEAAGIILTKALSQMGEPSGQEGEREDMDGITSFIERRIAPIAGRIGANPIINIIKDALMATMALLIIGSMATLLANLPIEALASFVAPINPLLNGISACTTGLLALYVAAAMGFYGSSHLGSDKVPAVLTSVAAFALTQYSDETGVNIEGLGTMGLFTAMVVSLSVVYTLHYFEANNIGIKLPESVPPRCCRLILVAHSGGASHGMLGHRVRCPRP